MPWIFCLFEVHVSEVVIGLMSLHIIHCQMTHLVMKNLTYNIVMPVCMASYMMVGYGHANHAF
jgi:hypothetical protein